MHIKPVSDEVVICYTNSYHVNCLITCFYFQIMDRLYLRRRRRRRRDENGDLDDRQVMLYSH